MLRELSKYQNLGTPSYYYELLIAFRDQPDEKWNYEKAKGLFYNRVVDGRNVFDGCVPFLEFLEIIQPLDTGFIKADEEFFQFLVSQRLMTDKLVEKLMIKLCGDDSFHLIFRSEFISKDIIYQVTQIDNSAFTFKYSRFKQLLLDIGVLKPHPVLHLNKFIFNKHFQRLFEKSIFPEIRKRKVGIEALKAQIEQKKIHGEEAEKFVFAYEKKRLKRKEGISWVAEYSAGDGYDIASFNDIESASHDRFIEVKSYENSPYFFWSRNEMDIARVKKSSYFLYLVNRARIKDSSYHPLIIQNPYESIYKNSDDWDQRVEKIRFKRIVE